jgi:hypothetical protein
MPALEFFSNALACFLCFYWLCLPWFSYAYAGLVVPLLVKNTNKGGEAGDKNKIPSKGDFKNHCLVEFVET